MGLLDRLPWRDSGDAPPPPVDADEQYFAELDEEFPLEEIRAEIAADEAVVDPLDEAAEIIRDAVREAERVTPRPLPDQDLRDALRERDERSPAEEDSIWPRTRASRRLDP